MTTDLMIRALAALAQRHRLAAFRMLVAAGPEGLSAGTISSRLELAPSTVSHHLSQLENGGLVAATRSGRHQIYRLDPRGTRALMRFLTQDCCAGDAELIGALGESYDAVDPPRSAAKSQAATTTTG